MTRAGTLDRRITIQRAVTTQDGYGQPIETWETFAERWAASRMRWRGGTRNSPVDIGTAQVRVPRIIRTRYLTSVLPIGNMVQVTAL